MRVSSPESKAFKSKQLPFILNQFTHFCTNAANVLIPADEKMLDRRSVNARCILCNLVNKCTWECWRIQVKTKIGTQKRMYKLIQQLLADQLCRMIMIFCNDGRNYWSASQEFISNIQTMCFAAKCVLMSKQEFMMSWQLRIKNKHNINTTFLNTAVQLILVP